MFIKQVPVHLRARLKKLDKLRKIDEIKFIKQVPAHPRDRLKRKRKRELVNYKELSKKSKNDDVVFIKQISIHPRDRFKKLEAIDEKVKLIKVIKVPVHLRDRLRKKNMVKNKEDQIARDNVSKLMRGEFDFNSEKTLKKHFYSILKK